MGKQDCLYLGNLEAVRDWGHAKDYIRVSLYIRGGMDYICYMKAMWMILQQDDPGDYVIASNEAHSVREFVEKAFGHVGIQIE